MQSKSLVATYLLLLTPGILKFTVAAIVQTFSFMASNQYFIVPNGVTYIQVVVAGGAGGCGDDSCGVSAGGNGAVYSAVILTTPGETLTIRTGGQGSSDHGVDGNALPVTGGFNGGRSGINCAGGGGGRSEIQNAAYILIIAGGGGGGYACGCWAIGGNGGVPNGSNGQQGGCAYGPILYGYGGTQSANGASPTVPTNPNSSGGGGGGGYYYGGNGYWGSGGGGGSSYCNPTYCQSASGSASNQNSNGYVTITYNTMSPTITPSLVPSTQPSANPSILPSLSPSSPSKIPTAPPSIFPSSSPTCIISLCSAGQYATSTSTCVPCPAGQFTSYADQTSCSSCPVGTYNTIYSPYSTTACLPCPAGLYANALIGASACILCPSGRYSAVGFTTCVPCVAGQYAPSVGFSFCLLCPPATSSQNGMSTCSLCPA